MGNGWRRRAERGLHRGRQAEFQRRSAGFHRVRVGHLPGAAKALGAPIELLSPAESCPPLVPCCPLCTACSRWARQVRLIQVSGRDGAMPRPRGRKARAPLSDRRSQTSGAIPPSCAVAGAGGEDVFRFNGLDLRGLHVRHPLAAGLAASPHSQILGGCDSDGPRPPPPQACGCNQTRATCLLCGPREHQSC